VNELTEEQEIREDDTDRIALEYIELRKRDGSIDGIKTQCCGLGQTGIPCESEIP